MYDDEETDQSSLLFIVLPSRHPETKEAASMLTLFPLYVQARISERRAIKIHDIFKCLNDTGHRLGYGLVLDPCAGCLLCSSFSLAGRKEDLQNRKISHLFCSRRAIYERKLLWTTSCPSIYFSPSRVLSLQIFIMFFPLEFRRASCFDRFFFSFKPLYLHHKVADQSGFTQRLS